MIQLVDMYLFVVVCLGILTPRTKAISDPLYVNERPYGAEQMHLPPILLYTLQMTTAFTTRQYIRLTLESMRHNPQVDFVIISVLDDVNEINLFHAFLHGLMISNVKLQALSTSEFVKMLKVKLNMDHPMTVATQRWARKMPEFRPLIAHLFPEHLERRHRYWGYFDMDLILGNLSHYAHWFQGEYPVVKTSYHCIGPLQFFLNDKVFVKFFVEPNRYVDVKRFHDLLKEEMNFDLDENGFYTNNRVNANLSVDSVMVEYLRRNNYKWNGGDEPHSDYLTNVMIDDAKSLHGRHGAVVWQRGSLKLLGSSSAYPAGREVMYYHRPFPDMGLQKVPSVLREDIIDDMLTYGFLLPSWTPLITRYYCRRAVTKVRSIFKYSPYERRCFGKNVTLNVLIRDKHIQRNIGKG